MNKKYFKNLEELRKKIDSYKYSSSDDITKLLAVRKRLQKKRNYEFKIMFN